MEHSYIDEYSGLNSFIHRLEPRIKIISFFAFVLFVVLTPPRLFISFALYGAIISILILLSKIPLFFIFKRSLAVVPFVLLIAVFAPFVKQGQEGWFLFWGALAKAYLSILSMTVLMSSMRFSDFLKALERLKFPKLIVMILSFMYRYIFVVYDQMLKMKQAKDARSLAGAPKSFQIRTLANMIGVLFIRSYERGEAVYLAMCSRGFNGRINTISNYQITAKDILFLLTVISLLTGIRLAG